MKGFLFGFIFAAIIAALMGFFFTPDTGATVACSADVVPMEAPVCWSTITITTEDNADSCPLGAKAETIVPVQDKPVQDEAVVVPDVVPDVVDPPVVVPDTDKPADTCGNGNPGNHKCVGNAGEDPNHKDTMDNDSTDGNGEHGNQGTNGNSDHANNKDK